VASPTSGETVTRTAERRGLSLGARMFLAFALVVALAVGVALAATYYLIGAVAERAVETSLANSRSVQRYFRQLRTRQLELTAELIASDPYFGGYVAEAVNADDPELAARSIGDLLTQERSEFGLDLAIVIDAGGDVIARTDRPRAMGRNLADRALVARARTDLVPVTGLWLGPRGLFQAAVTPIAQGRTVVGFLIAGLSLDDELANDVKRVSGADVAYLHVAGDEPELLSTTLDVPSADRLMAALRDAGELAPALARGGDTAATHPVTLGDDRWVVQLTPLDDPEGRIIGAAIAMTSLEQALAAYRNIPVLVLLTGLAAVVVALLLSYLLSQRILGPVRWLTEAAEAAVNGDFGSEVATGRGDEIGRLSRAFDSLLSSLREKRDVEDYLADVSRHVGAADAGTGDRAGTEEIAETRVLESPADAEPPRLGPRYSLIEEVGAGAMGVVYKAHDRRLDEVVAIKMLKPGSVDDEHLERFLDELKTARRITHPNVLRTYDFGEVDGQPYISMEYVNGLTLRTLLAQKGRLPYGAALRVARQVCAGLAAVHELGVVHRDVKPGNVMLEHRGNAKLMDFGISLSTDSAVHDRPDTVVGTPHYLAPEQVRGDPADARADVFAMGVLLQELFTGGLPFSGDSGKAIAAARLIREPEPPASFWPEVPEELSAIILRCLARNPDQRYRDAGELGEALGTLRG